MVALSIAATVSLATDIPIDAAAVSLAAAVDLHW